MRMAPLDLNDVMSMIESLKGYKIIKGYRGNAPVNIDRLSETIIKFSELIMQIEDKIQSVDLNPVICSKEKCIIADARIILNN